MDRLVQICRTSPIALSAYVTENVIAVALIQEPWTYNGRVRGLGVGGRQISYYTLDANRRTCMAANRSVKWIPLWELCFKDLVAIKLLVTKARCDMEGNTQICIPSLRSARWVIAWEDRYKDYSSWIWRQCALDYVIYRAAAAIINKERDYWSI